MRAPVRVEDDPLGFRRILLDRPDTKNAIDSVVVSLLRRGIADAPGGVVVLGSADPSIFCSGADLKLGAGDRADVSEELYLLYEEMRATDKVIVAAVSGPAVGGGAQLLVASDLRLASPSAMIRFVGPGHGLVVGAWGLPALIGRGRAADLCLSMRPVGVEEALAIGLVDQLVEDPRGAADEYAAAICKLDPDSVATVKRVVSMSDSGEAMSAERRHNSRWDGSIPEQT
ncbi:MAG TPA: enoyl-CoA hydratase/isomerase family protein [Acidimicrobiia bacterium]|nr:enoyl-CoA hydratase/isomerase family protein [Acidimicrobiia bacterium]